MSAFSPVGDWAPLIGRTDVLILDTETTGLGERAEVLEVAVIDTTGAVRFQSLALPVGRIPSEASNVNGLTRSVLKAKGAPSWPVVHKRLLAALQGASVVLAWNAPYDKRILAQTAQRHGLEFPTRLTWRDVLEEYRGLRRGGSSNALQAVAKREGVTIKGAGHRALVDCLAVLAIIEAMARRPISD